VCCVWVHWVATPSKSTLVVPPFNSVECCVSPNNFGFNGPRVSLKGLKVCESALPQVHLKVNEDRSPVRTRKPSVSLKTTQSIEGLVLLGGTL